MQESLTKPGLAGHRLLLLCSIIIAIFDIDRMPEGCLGRPALLAAPDPTCLMYRLQVLNMRPDNM